MVDRAPSSSPAAPLALVGAGLLAAAATGVLVSFWVGGLVLALVLAGCAVARLLLPVAAVGPLAVRSRGVDAATCGLLAAGIALLAVIAPGGLLAVLVRGGA